jgi:hypothetical protein
VLLAAPYQKFGSPVRLMLLIICVVGSGWAQNPSPESSAKSSGERGKVLFREHVRELLETRCLACHGGQFKKSGLDLSSRETLLKGGDRGPAVVPGDPKASLVYKAIAHIDEPHMPYQADKLPDAVIAEVGNWILAGAPYEAPLKVAAVGSSSSQAGLHHWAFQAPKKPPVPPVKTQDWVRNPIDSFVAAERDQRGLVPAAPADKRVLLRRVYLDLIGLPPSPKEMADFLADRSDDAYEKVVDRLLASPRYGERWGRHWMDIWRYSDWYGFRQNNDVRNAQRNMWYWRDWIVDSLNEDKGYDRMILEMLAGDEIAPNDPKTLRATGYLVRNWYRFSRNVWLEDTVEHTAAGFLGITLKCARCHDHKYDPIKQEEYYQFRAFFEPYDVRLDRVPGGADVDKNGLPRVFDGEPRDATTEAPFLPAIYSETHLFIRGDEKNPDSKTLAPNVPRILGGTDIKIVPVKLNFEATYPDFRSFVHLDLITQTRTEIENAEAALTKANAELEKARRMNTDSPDVADSAAGHDDKAGNKEDPATRLKKAESARLLAEKHLATLRAFLPALEARIAADKAKYGTPPDPSAEALAVSAKKAERTANLARAEEAVDRVNQLLAEAKVSADPLAKDTDEKLADARKRLKEAQDALEPHADYTPIGKIYPNSSTGRRFALARWIASQQNPLTARVAINHIWLRHFGTALVPTVNNFGLNGKPPSHPALLDWLAVEFMERNWSMKAIHRLMVTSNIYRMQSDVGGENPNFSKDPDNKYYWRMNSRRMEAEAVRDSILQVSGQLDPTMGGPEIDEKLGETSRRRSLYFQHAPDVQVQFLGVFDLASPAECYERTESVVPQQALALANSNLSFTQARILARQLSKQTGGEANTNEFIRAAFEQILGRPPSAQEVAKSTSFLLAQAQRLRDPAKLTAFKGQTAPEVPAASEPWLRTREDLVHVLFNHNEFVTIR